VEGVPIGFGKKDEANIDLNGIGTEGMARPEYTSKGSVIRDKSTVGRIKEGLLGLLF